MKLLAQLTATALILFVMYGITGCAWLQPKVCPTPNVPEFMAMPCGRPLPLLAPLTLEQLLGTIDQRQIDQLDCADRMDMIRLRLQKH